MAQTYQLNRLAYEIIGARVYILDKSSWTTVELDISDVALLNKVSTDVISAANRAKSVVFVFPEMFNLLATMVWTDGAGSYNVWGSQTSDITNPNSWTIKANLPCGTGTGDTAAFTGLQGAAAGSYKALMFDEIGATSPSSGIGMIHLFGSRDVGDRLEIFNAIEESLIDPVNFGDVIQGSTSDSYFRVRNMSESLTASTITISIDDAYSTLSPSVASEFYISTDDGFSFTASGSLSSLGPTQASGRIILRRVTSTDIPTGDHLVRLNASAGSWS